MDLLREFWAYAVAAVAVVAWLIRVESRGLANEKEIKRLWEQRKEDLATAQTQRNQTNAMLAEIREDVKAILRTRP